MKREDQLISAPNTEERLSEWNVFTIVGKFSGDKTQYNLDDAKNILT